MIAKRYVISYLLILATMLAAVWLLNYIVDPYGYNDTRITNYDKREISYPQGRNLYKLSRFRHSNAKTVLVGDSTINSLDVEVIAPVLSTEVFNFGVGGQTMFDTIDVTRYAVKHGKVETVVLGIPFRHFDDNSRAKVFDQIASSVEAPLVANFSMEFTKASAIGILSYIKKDSRIKPNTTSAFLENQLASISNKVHARRYPIALKDQIEKLLCDLVKQNVQYVLLVMPVSPEIREVIYKVYENEYREYKNWLYNLGKVVDYDVHLPQPQIGSGLKDHVHADSNLSKKLLLDILSRIKSENYVNPNPKIACDM